MRARERGEHQVADIGMARVNGQARGLLHLARDGVDVGEIEAGVNALRIEIERQVDQVHIARALAVAEQTTFDAIRARQQAELGRRDAGAAIVVGVQRQHHVFAPLEVRRHPLDLVGVDIGRRVLDRGRQVDDDRAGRDPRPRREWRVLQASSATGSSVMLKVSGEYSSPHSVPGNGVGQLLDQPDLLRDQLHHLRHAQAEHHAAPHRRGGVVHVHDGAARAAHRLDRAADEFLARLREHHDGDVVGNQLLLDEIAHGLEIRLRGRREPDLDFLEAHRTKRLEQPLLGLAAHGLEQGLVAVAQIRAAPHRHRS